MSEPHQKTPKKEYFKLNWANIKKKKVLSKAKIDIALHPAKTKIIIGAKGTGKTIIPMVKGLIEYESDQYFNMFGFRKHKEQATNKLSSFFFQTYNILKMHDFEFKLNYELRSQQAAIFRIYHYRNMNLNQVFKFGSLDNASGSTDGGAPGNGGYYGIIIDDEPVIEKDAGDPKKIPSKDAWDKDQSIIVDNLDRFNDNFSDITKRDVGTETYHLMNNWGLHPLIVLANEIFPEDTFMNYVLGMTMEELFSLTEEEVKALFKNKEFLNRLMRNNTLSVESKKIDTLITRMTKFANPNNWKPEKAAKLLKRIENSVLMKNQQQLTILLGTLSIPEIDKEMLVFNIKDFNLKTLEEFLEEGFEISKVNYSWDIDTSRVLTLTPTYVLNKKRAVGGFGRPIVNKPIEIIYWDTQIELVAYGTGEIGELNDLYIKQMIRVMDKHWKKVLKNDIKIKAIVSVDDKRKWFLNELYKQKKYYMGLFRTFEQHGDADIEHRQDAMKVGLQNKSLWISPKNQNLIQDIKVCVKRDLNDSRRKTSGNTNYLDRLDSAENGFWPFVPIIWKRQRMQVIQKKEKENA